jgi:hypothetical protein
MRQLTRAQLFDLASAAGDGQTFRVSHADLYMTQRLGVNERYVLRQRAPARLSPQYSPAPPDWRPDAGLRVNWRRPAQSWVPSPSLLFVMLDRAAFEIEVPFEGDGDRFHSDGSLIIGHFRLELYAPDGLGDTPGWFNRRVDAQLVSLVDALQGLAERESVGLRIGDQVIAAPPPSPPDDRLRLNGRVSLSALPADGAPAQTTVGNVLLVPAVEQLLASNASRRVTAILRAGGLTTVLAGCASCRVTRPDHEERLLVGEHSLVAQIDSFRGEVVDLTVFATPIDVGPMLESLLAPAVPVPTRRPRRPFVDLED